MNKTTDNMGVILDHWDALNSLIVVIEKYINSDYKVITREIVSLFDIQEYLHSDVDYLLSSLKETLSLDTTPFTTPKNYSSCDDLSSVHLPPEQKLDQQ